MKRFVAGGSLPDAFQSASDQATPRGVRSAARAASQAAPALPPSNVGHQLLTKAGWLPGSGLGVDGQGLTQPVPAFLKGDRRGVGGETSLKVVGAPVVEVSVLDPALQAAAARSQARAATSLATRKRQREEAVVAALRADFRDAGDAVADANPLLRGSGKLSASNPLRSLH